MYPKLIRNFCLLACISLHFASLYSMENEGREIPKNLRYHGKRGISWGATDINIGAGQGYQNGFAYELKGSCQFYGNLPEDPIYIIGVRFGKWQWLYDGFEKFVVQFVCNIVSKEKEKILHDCLITEGIIKEGSEDVGNARKNSQRMNYEAYFNKSCFKNTLSSKKGDDFYLDYENMHGMDVQCLSFVSPEERSIWDFILPFSRLELIDDEGLWIAMQGCCMTYQIGSLKTPSGTIKVLKCRDLKDVIEEARSTIGILKHRIEEIESFRQTT